MVLLHYAQIGHTVQQADGIDGEDPYYRTVQALRTGQYLQDHRLTELAGVLTNQAGSGFTRQMCIRDRAGAVSRWASAPEPLPKT